MLMTATVVQVLYVLLQLLVVAAIILSFKFYCKFHCVFYFTCDRSFMNEDLIIPVNGQSHYWLDTAWRANPTPALF